MPGSDRITLEPNKAMTAIVDHGEWAEVEFADGTSTNAMPSWGQTDCGRKPGA